jgi:hypothetical protein
MSLIAIAIAIAIANRIQDNSPLAPELKPLCPRWLRLIYLYTPYLMEPCSRFYFTQCV